jgi:uncharacterized protein YfdQ (DUF2303 family)
VSDATDKLLTDAFEAGRQSYDPRTAYAIETTTNGAQIAIRVGDEGKVEIADDVQRELDARADRPLRRKGSHVLSELGAFCAFVNRNKTADSAIYADMDSMTLTCVLNEAPAQATLIAAWRDYRAIYSCPRSPAWKEWTALDGKQMAQEAFADFVEAHLEHLTQGKGYPAPTEVLQMARDLTVLTKGTYKRTINVTTGASILECKTDTDTGSTVIPRAFLLAIPVFDGGALYQVEARIRMQMVNGAPCFLYQLHRRTEIERDAFGEVRGIAQDQTALPLFAGKP